MKKHYSILVLLGIFLIGSVFGALIVRYVWQVNMGMRLVVSYDLEFEYINGTDITNYDWGDFNPGEAKSLRAALWYRGNVAGAYITWNTTNLPAGWDLTVDRPQEPDPSIVWPSEELWGPTSAGPFAFQVRINLTETSGTPNQAEAFTFNFMSGEGP